ncbi:hypothetical protein E2C01_013673 [Portunus trituberculatus]|uniref:Uncharacterized protein n=1 Tax=Portunus trituberculatus TaxID=210409 RepID=A0A5B7DI45_PORTR|nr:hypothetical protein [Portunus trituberculatus]
MHTETHWNTHDTLGLLAVKGRQGKQLSGRHYKDDRVAPVQLRDYNYSSVSKTSIFSLVAFTDTDDSEWPLQRRRQVEEPQVMGGDTRPVINSGQCSPVTSFPSKSSGWVYFIQALPAASVTPRGLNTEPGCL